MSVSEYRFEDFARVATAAFHAERAAADHLNQPEHVGRLLVVAGLVNDLLFRHGYDQTVIDYGCGNGGLISLLHGRNVRGFDFTPANVAAAQAAGRNVEHRNFVEHPEPSDIAVMTEVLEHMDDPHGFLAALDAPTLVASVPNGETPDNHGDCHLWGWDADGFLTMLTGAGYSPARFVPLGPTQVWLAVR